MKQPPSQKSFVNLSLWRWHRLQAARGGGERHSRQNFDVQSVRREVESWREICLSNPASERTCQCHPSWLLGFHIWIEWSAMKTERAWRRWCSEAERAPEKWNWKMRIGKNKTKKNAFTKYLRSDKRCGFTEEPLSQMLKDIQENKLTFFKCSSMNQLSCTRVSSTSPACHESSEGLPMRTWNRH